MRSILPAPAKNVNFISPPHFPNAVHPHKTTLYFWPESHSMLPTTTSLSHEKLLKNLRATCDLLSGEQKTQIRRLFRKDFLFSTYQQSATACLKNL